MNFVEPLHHPDTRTIRDTAQSWLMAVSAEHTGQEILELSQPLFNALNEYKRSSTDKGVPNWQDRLAYDIALLTVDSKIRELYPTTATDGDGVQSAFHKIRSAIEQAQPNPLHDSFKEFKSKEQNGETVDQFLQRVQPLLDMLDLYLEKEFYPSWESQQAWKQSEHYDSERHDWWFQRQYENSSEDRHLMNSVIGVISSLEHDLIQSGNELPDQDEARLRLVATQVVQNCKLF